MKRPAQRLLALALAGAAITAASARALGQSSHEATAGAPGKVAPDVSPGVSSGVSGEVSLDSVITPVIEASTEKLGGPTWQPLPALAHDARAALARSAPKATATAETGPEAKSEARPEAKPEAKHEAMPDVALHGDPGMGCFVLALRMGSGSAAMHDALREALSRPGQDAPAWTLRDWSTAPVPGPAPAGAPAGTPPVPVGTRSTFAFTGEDLQGEVRVLSRGMTPPADTMAVACFYNEREPERSARLCQRMLPALEAALATIPAPRPIPETSP